MERYVGIDVHAASCTLAVLGASGKRLQSLVVETNGRALVNAIKTIPGRLHVCLEEGTQSAWLHELLQPHVEEVVVMVAPETNGPKSDARDAWSRAEELRVGAIKTRVFKAPPQFAFLRNAVRAHQIAVRDLSRAKNRLRAVFRSRGVRVQRHVYAEAARTLWVKQLPTSYQPLAQWLGQQLDALKPLHDAAAKWLLKEAKTHPIITTLKTAPGMGSIRTAQVVAIVVNPFRFRTRQQFWSYCGLGIVTRLQGRRHDRDPADARASAARGLPADARRGHQAEPRQAHAGSPHRSDRAVDVEAQGGLRPAAQQRSHLDIGAATSDANTVRGRVGTSRRERFEGEHPASFWSPGRDGKTPFKGYAPSEYPLKRWPAEALSGGWCPAATGAHSSFRFERVAKRPRPTSWTRVPPEPSRPPVHRPAGAHARISNRPLHESDGRTPEVSS